MSVIHFHFFCYLLENLRKKNERREVSREALGDFNGRRVAGRGQGQAAAREGPVCRSNKKRQSKIMFEMFQKKGLGNYLFLFCGDFWGIHGFSFSLCCFLLGEEIESGKQKAWGFSTLRSVFNFVRASLRLCEQKTGWWSIPGRISTLFVSRKDETVDPEFVSTSCERPQKYVQMFWIHREIYLQTRSVCKQFLLKRSCGFPGSKCSLLCF